MRSQRTETLTLRFAPDIPESQGLRTGCTVSKTFPDDTLPGGPVQWTIVYRTPFVRPDREEDYRVARAFLEAAQGSTPPPSGSC